MAHRTKNKITEYKVATDAANSTTRYGRLIKTVYRFRRRLDSNISSIALYHWASRRWRPERGFSPDYEATLKPITKEEIRAMYQPADDWPNLF